MARLDFHLVSQFFKIFQVNFYERPVQTRGADPSRVYISKDSLPSSIKAQNPTNAPSPASTASTLNPTDSRTVASGDPSKAPSRKHISDAHSDSHSQYRPDKLESTGHPHHRQHSEEHGNAQIRPSNDASLKAQSAHPPIEMSTFPLRNPLRVFGSVFGADSAHSAATPLQHSFFLRVD